MSLCFFAALPTISSYKGPDSHAYRHRPNAASFEEEGFAVLPRVVTGRHRPVGALWAVAIAVVALGVCGSLSSTVRSEPSLLAVAEPPSSTVGATDSAGSSSATSELTTGSVESPAVPPAAGDGGLAGVGRPGAVDDVVVERNRGARFERERGLPADIHANRLIRHT